MIQPWVEAWERSSQHDCSAAEIRRLYQQRHRIFWSCQDFTDLQSSFACYPMLDDHEVIDNFGSDPAHVGPDWERIRSGAIDAFFDYQGARIHPRCADGSRPASLDYGFEWGQAAVWGMDIRSQRRTEDGITTVYTDAQFEAMSRFLAKTSALPLLVIMTPIPLVHVEGKRMRLAAALMGQGSDMHERWSHPQCIRDRNRLVSVLLDHHKSTPHQRMVLVGGDVHAGAAFQIDFDDGLQMLQLTSSAISNVEGWLVEKACEHAARTVDSVELDDGREGKVRLLDGMADDKNVNPLGRLNAGIVDVYDHQDRVGIGFRLLTHDSDGGPVTVFDTGELGMRTDPAVRLTGIGDLPNR